MFSQPTSDIRFRAAPKKSARWLLADRTADRDCDHSGDFNGRDPQVFQGRHGCAGNRRREGDHDHSYGAGAVLFEL